MFGGMFFEYNISIGHRRPATFRRKGRFSDPKPPVRLQKRRRFLLISQTEKSEDRGILAFF